MASLSFLFRTSAPAAVDENSDDDHYTVTAGGKAEGVGVAHIVDADTPHSGSDADSGIKGKVESAVGSAAAMGCGTVDSQRTIGHPHDTVYRTEEDTHEDTACHSAAVGKE
mgnify:CR=1 FL=1